MAIPSIRPEALPQLCQSIVEDPQKLDRFHRRNGWLYRLVFAVSAVALFILFSGATAIYFGVLPPLPIWQLGIGIVASHFCHNGLKLWSVGAEQLTQANFYRSVAVKLQGDAQIDGMKDWGTAEVQHFLVEQGIYEEPSVPEISAALAMHGIDSPVALLPLIARFKMLEEQVKKVKAVYENNLVRAGNFIYPDETRLEAEHRFVAIDALEKLAPLQLHCAVLLQNLHCPTVEYDVVGISLSKNPNTRPPNAKFPARALFKINSNEPPLGFLQMKVRDARILDFMANRDRVFLELLNGDKLTLEQVKDLPPNELRDLIFDQVPPLQRV